jgi:hypothetical protein
LAVKQGQFLKLLKEIEQEPTLMNIGDFFDQQSKDEIDYESDNIQIVSTKDRGRSVAAKKAFRCGEKILEIDEPLLMTVNQDHMHLICSNCLKEPSKVQPLKTCS